MVVNISIIIVSIQIIRTFILSIRFNIDEKFYSKQVKEYVLNRINKIENCDFKEQERKLKKLKNNITQIAGIYSVKSIEEIKIYENDTEYKKIISDKYGMISGYDTNRLNTIINNIQKKYTILPENNKKKNFIILIKKIGDKIKKEEVVAYCLKYYADEFKDSNEYIEYKLFSTYYGVKIDFGHESVEML